MKKEYYTYLGCSIAVENYISSVGEAAPEDVKEACAKLADIRVKLLKDRIDYPSDTFEELFEWYALSIREATHTLKESELFSEHHSVLNDLLDHYYNVAHFLRKGGGGGCGYADCTASFYHTSFYHTNG